MLGRSCDRSAGSKRQIVANVDPVAAGLKVFQRLELKAADEDSIVHRHLKPASIKMTLGMDTSRDASERSNNRWRTGNRSPFLIRMAEIFLSYAREDEPHASALVAALESHGWSVWWDSHLMNGQDFREHLQQELDSAHCIVVLWSKRIGGVEIRAR